MKRLKLKFNYQIYNWRIVDVKRNACKEKVLKPKSNLAFSADQVHLNLITQSNTTLVVFENILNFRLMLTSKGEVSSLKRCCSTLEEQLEEVWPRPLSLTEKLPFFGSVVKLKRDSAVYTSDIISLYETSRALYIARAPQFKANGSAKF